MTGAPASETVATMLEFLPRSRSLLPTYVAVRSVVREGIGDVAIVGILDLMPLEKGLRRRIAKAIELAVVRVNGDADAASRAVERLAGRPYQPAPIGGVVLAFPDAARSLLSPEVPTLGRAERPRVGSVALVRIADLLMLDEKARAAVADAVDHEEVLVEPDNVGDAVVLHLRETATPEALPREIDVSVATGPHQGSPAPATGRLRIGKYKLIRELGAGGMGEVWIALDPDTDREVALKLIRQDDDPDFDTKLKRFRIEGSAAAAALHPNVVTIFEAGAADGVRYLVMELLKDYQELQDALRALGPCPFELAAKLMLQANEALRAIHTKGFVHRDIKPGNLLVNVADAADPKLKILDFGIAKKIERPATKSASGAPITGEYVIGTPDYMSPEQWDSAPLTAQSDFYSLGCVLYQVLTGTPPFATCPRNVRDANAPHDRTRLLSPTQKLVAHAQWRPDPIPEFRADVPRELVAICEKMMAKQAGGRHQSHDELKAELVGYLEGGELRRLAFERDSLKRTAFTRAAIVYGVLLLALFAAGLFVILRRPFTAAAPAPKVATVLTPDEERPAPGPAQPPPPDATTLEVVRQNDLGARVSGLLAMGDAIAALALAIDEKLNGTPEQFCGYASEARGQADAADAAFDPKTLRRYVAVLRQHAKPLTERGCAADERDLADFERHARAAEALQAALARPDRGSRLAALEEIILAHRNTPAWPAATKHALHTWSAELEQPLDVGDSRSWTVRVKPERSAATEPDWGNVEGALVVKDALTDAGSETIVYKEIAGAHRGWSMKVGFTPLESEGARFAASMTGVPQPGRIVRVVGFAPAPGGMTTVEIVDLSPTTPPKRLGKSSPKAAPAHEIAFAVLEKSWLVYVDGSLVDAGAITREAPPSAALAIFVSHAEVRITQLRIHK